MPLFKTEITTLGLSEVRSDSLGNPAIPLNSPAVWDELFGGQATASGERINEGNALKITTVYACIRVLAESVASLPLKLYERTSTGRLEAVDAPLYYLLTVAPNPEQTAYKFKETLIGCLALTGNAYAQIERNGANQPIALWPLHPLKTEPVRLPNNKLAYKTSDGMAPGQTRIVPSDDILHVSLFSLDGLKGLSPITMARQALGLTSAAEKFGARFFGNGTRAGAVLSTKTVPDPKTRQELKESWEGQQGGVNQGKTALLFGDWTYNQIGLSPEDSQFLGTRQFMRTEVAAMWRVPSHLVGDNSKLSGSNSEQMALQFVTYTLRPYLSNFEAEIISKLMPTVGRKANKYFVEFDVSDMLRVDFKTQQEGYAAGRQWGWYTGNDVLKRLGENPGGTELDTYLVPVNMQNAKRLLDTESVQDQPVDAALPTQAERNMLGVYTRSYIKLYRDAFGRLMKRNKRDYDTLSALFRPVLRSIADTATAEIGLYSDTADSTINDALRAMERRAAKWPKTLTAGEVDTQTQAEFVRAVRSIHIATSREIAAAKASAELEPATEWNGNEDAQDAA